MEKTKNSEFYKKYNFFIEELKDKKNDKISIKNIKSYKTDYECDEILGLISDMFCETPKTEREKVLFRLLKDLKGTNDDLTSE